MKWKNNSNVFAVALNIRLLLMLKKGFKSVFVPSANRTAFAGYQLRKNNEITALLRGIR